MKWYLAGWKHYAVFRGRAGRMEYWMFQLINAGIMFVLFLSDFWLGGFGTLAALLFYLAALVPTIAVAVRRLHDTGHSGGWFLIAWVPLAGPILFLVFMLQDSPPGENRYGPNPKTADPPPW